MYRIWGDFWVVLNAVFWDPQKNISSIESIVVRYRYYQIRLGIDTFAITTGNRCVVFRWETIFRHTLGSFSNKPSNQAIADKILHRSMHIEKINFVFIYPQCMEFLRSKFSGLYALKILNALKLDKLNFLVSKWYTRLPYMFKNIFHPFLVFPVFQFWKFQVQRVQSHSDG